MAEEFQVGRTYTVKGALKSFTIEKINSTVEVRSTLQPTIELDVNILLYYFDNDDKEQTVSIPNAHIHIFTLEANVAKGRRPVLDIPEGYPQIVGDSSINPWNGNYKYSNTDVISNGIFYKNGIGAPVLSTGGKRRSLHIKSRRRGKKVQNKRKLRKSKKRNTG